MKASLLAAVAAAALLAPAAVATNAPPVNGRGLIDHRTTCYGWSFGDWPGIAVEMTPLAAGGTFWITVAGVDRHFLVQSATITIDGEAPHTYVYGVKSALDTVIHCYGEFPGYTVESTDVLIR